MNYTFKALEALVKFNYFPYDTQLHTKPQEASLQHHSCFSTALTKKRFNLIF